jgi:two-component system response regulator RstA
MKKTILLIEDNAKLANFLKKRLIKAGYQVSLESQGDKAVYRIIREQPDLVILDIMLPGMNGKQICQSVRHNYSGNILMLTALEDEQTEVASLHLGADSYLTKPVADEVLIAHIAALFRRQSRIDAIKSIKLDALEVNLVAKEAYLSGEKINLSPSEFDLLALLAINHDITLSRDNIMLALRGHDYDGIDRTIDLRISRLRKLLKDNENQPQRIKTAHGKGYVLVSTAWKI